MIRVLIADDQDLVRAGLRSLLANAEDIEVVGEAINGKDAVAQVRSQHPEVVLMDIRMPGSDGIEATRRIRADEELHSTAVLILTTFDDDADILDAIRLGAAGYLLKDTSADALRDAIRTVAAGDSVLSPAITRRIMAHLASLPEPRARDGRLEELTERELEVLARIGRGENNEEIGQSLHISTATARTYVSRILGKLHARDRTELAILAHRSGLVED
ncbi:MAG: response regulator transcription factor [Gulosibacter sp.]|uniref:response regulator transcription factor n=1 Tax=Gulosibacter sp. TaxID=2817531 RepID=UPI003F930179